jgi:hypothetical protein
LVLHGHYDPHLIFEYGQRSHQHIAFFDETDDDLVVVLFNLLFISAALINRDGFAESREQLVCAKVWQLIEALLELADGSQEDCKFLRLVEVGKPRDVLHEFVQEVHALLNESLVFVADGLLFRHRWHVQTEEPTVKDIPQLIKLFVSSEDLKLP